MICTDPPYGQSAATWDTAISLPILWSAFKRLILPGAAVVMTAMQPFTSSLVLSNRAWFRYALVWEKSSATGFLDANRRPLRAHEDIVVFGPTNPRYRPQFDSGKPYVARRRRRVIETIRDKRAITLNRTTVNTGRRFPRSVLKFARDVGHHPTQKPAALMRWLIATFTDQGDTVLDPFMGSGTTGVAARQLGRRFIGIELDRGYFATAKRRIREANQLLEVAS